MRATCAAMWLCVGLAACGGSSETSRPAARPAPTPPQAELAPPPGPALDDRVTAAVARIDLPMLQADLELLTRSPRTASVDPADPAARHLAASADHIAAEFAAAGLRVTRQTVEHGSLRADNVIGDRLGSEPARVILLGAHYDSVAGSPGADDNASGVAAMLAVARATSGVPTEAGLRFVAFAFEEDGLAGSSDYVRRLPRGEDQRIEVALALDMVGYRATGPRSQRYPENAETLVMLATGLRLPREGDYIGWFALDDLRPATISALREARAYAPGLSVFDLQLPRAALFQAGDLLRGDHASFWASNIRAVAVGDTGDFRNPHYHRATDTVATLDLSFARDVTRWLAAAVLLAAGPR